MPTNVWDITTPPDTQLANLLGLDIRSLKLDTQQRMALLSGTFAARWNPGTDIQPANWTGLLYFSTDTKQIFQWNGANWIDVTNQLMSSRVIFKSTAAIGHTGTISNDVIYTVPIPASILGTNGTLRITVNLQPTVQTGAGNSVIFMTFGGTQVLQATVTAASFPNVIHSNLSNRGATNSQICNTVTLAQAGPSNIQMSNVASAIDTTVLQNLVISIQNFVVGDNQTFHQCIVEVI